MLIPDFDLDLNLDLDLDLDSELDLDLDLDIYLCQGVDGRQLPNLGGLLGHTTQPCLGQINLLTTTIPEATIIEYYHWSQGFQCKW